jgi:hypothetical protein
MDTGVTIRPNANVAVQSYAPATVASPDPATTTDLPAAKAVTATSATTQTRNDTPATTHEVLIDPATREVIYRVIDVRSRQVVRQVPDEALLRTRAYAQAIAKGDTPVQALNQADLDVEA